MAKKVLIKRFDKSLPMPEYKTKGAAGFDLHARENTTIQPHQIGYIPLNVAVQTPKGYMMILAARGSMHKFGILPVHGIGIGDWDFRGDNDEYKMPALNFTNKAVTIEKGTRIAQGVFVKFLKANLKESKQLKARDRGGFGTTGHK